MEIEKVEDSIHKFEQKKEFHEVKLKTRQSFREDQVALERRLSKYRVKPKGIMSAENADGRTNGHGSGHRTPDSEKADTTGVDGLQSQLESIVIDISDEKRDERSRNSSINIDSEINGDHIYAVENDELVRNEAKTEGVPQNGLENKGYTDSRTDVRLTANGSDNDIGHTLSPRVNGHTGQPNGYPNGPYTKTAVVSNGGKHLTQNGHPAASHSTLIMRPKVNGHPRTSMTPEPRLKLAGIYQKNPKLTGASTEHLDTISLRGSKSGKVIVDYGLLTPIPAAEVTSLPADGNLCGQNVREMVTIFRLLHVPDPVVCRLSACKVDGKRFSLFSDKELAELGMGNPVIKYFRDRSSNIKKKRKNLFIL
ncbi:hypothetical protein MAR_038320 [Mya arenaria]|uniref:Uncharacterized protein n=1 Tax=Mya arenaria TaxID=6604 RepID=A0ABY7FV92_MYAAR|nr:hypothetical protein MAR_038320 [Mya arenaria]